MTCGIYMIQNKVNGKIYIGQSVDIEYRWKIHKRELRNNHHKNDHLQSACNEYGEDNFEFTIICECDESQLNTMEEYYIFELMSYDRRIGYNKNYGGGSGLPTEETRQKIGKLHKGKIVSEETRKKLSKINKGKTLSEEHRKKISKSTKIALSSPEVRKKISEASKGKNNPMYGRTGENSPWYGKHHSEESKKKMRENNAKTMLGKFGIKHHNSIPVVQLTLEGKLINVYGSAGEAERDGFNQCGITKCIKGKYKTHKGYKWMYLHEYIAKMHPNIKTINLFGKTYNVNREVAVQN